MDDAALILAAVDTVGIFVFGVAGGTLAVRRGFDVFGVAVLAGVTALAGGVVRDVMLGALPPAALTQPHYLWSALAAGAAAFFFHRTIEKLGRPILALDALGLGLFAAAGCRKALDYGVDAPAAALLAVVTGVGGGIVRDLLVNEEPRVLKEEIYASAALLAALIVIAGDRFGWPWGATATAAVAAAVVLRLVSYRRGWRAPRAPGSKPPER